MSDRYFLLWRRGDVIVATVADVPDGYPERLWFEGLECRPLECGDFFDHLLSREPGPQTPKREIVGFELFTIAADEFERQAMQDLLCAANISGDADMMQVLLRPASACESDGAQGFQVLSFVNPNGRVVIAIPEWDPSLVVGFESTVDGAPTISPPSAG